MEKIKKLFENKKYLLLYLIGVFILSSGVSFAFFTGSINFGGNTSPTVGTTDTPYAGTVSAEAKVDMDNANLFPGHKEIVTLKVTGTGSDIVLYNLIYNGINTFNTDINYKVYKSDSEIKLNTTCEKKTRVQSGVQILREECNITNIDELGNSITSGTINKTSTESKQVLLSDEAIETNKSGKVIYYYIEIEYPNLESNQNNDLNSNIKGVITVEDSNTKYMRPTLNLTASTVSGENNWYKSVDITGSITGTGSNFTGTYCIGNTVCIPTTNLTINNKTFNISIPNQAYSQVLCTNITDQYGISVSSCTDSYNVDEELPTVSITSESSDSNSITINVSGNDDYSKIDKYYYKIGNGSYEESTSTSKTFSGLNAGTSYTVYVYAKDKAGNESIVVSKTISTTASNVSNILAKYTKDNSRSGEITGKFEDETPTTVYSAPDDNGTSYVFAGVNPNNWVKIGNFYFRIIRFNGNGSMRLIYSGAGSAQTSGTGTQIGTKKFNTNYDDNMYVGLQYTSNQVHGTETNSTILGVSTSTDATTLYGWYNNNIKTTYGSLIDSNVGFCNDRDNYTDMNGNTSGGGIGQTQTYYGTYIRYEKGGTWQTSYTPTLKCKEASDLLKLPVGLITADEYALAGGGPGNSNANTTFWLHTGRDYWTMSPYSYSGSTVGYSYNYAVISNGYLANYRSSLDFGVRPVINLKSTTTFEDNGADGTSTKPYVVVAP